MVLAAAVLLISIAFVTLVGDYRVLSVQSDSMSPSIHAGDAVIVDTHNRHARVGDIISYSRPGTGGMINTHRVQAVDYARGILVTKGDNISSVDTVVPARAIIGTVRHVVPAAGVLPDLLKRPLGLAVCLYIPALGIIGYEVRGLSKNYRAAPRYYLLRR
jgi:signal peptidase I